VTGALHLDAAVVATGERVLGELTELSTAFTYAALVTDDGFEVTHAPRSQRDGNRFASMTSSIQALSDAVAQEMSIGASEYVIIASEAGHVIQLRVPGWPLVLAALFDDHETLGKALAVSRRCAETMSAALMRRPAVQAEAPTTTEFVRY
jgi:uncharacterized protein